MKVRINQDAPIADWRRLRQNTSMAWPYRSMISAVSVACEAILPGRVFGRDSYTPSTATVHVSSDVPALAVKHAGHGVGRWEARRVEDGAKSFSQTGPVEMSTMTTLA